MSRASRRWPASSQDGTLDSSFGVSGLTVVNFGVGGDGTPHANGVAIDGNGRIVMSGTAGNLGNITLVVARLWP